jgi:hypothetical protein
MKPVKPARWIFTVVIALLGLWACWAVAYPGDEKASGEKKPMLYELRIYTTHEGRLPALHKRFREHTMRLFEKHGMKNIIYWTPTDKDNTLVYVVAHQSLEAAERSWQGFRNDPEWHKAREASEADGPIVAKVERMFLSPTEYSPIK